MHANNIHAYTLSLSLYLLYLSFFFWGGGGECTVFICIYGSLSIYASNCTHTQSLRLDGRLAGNQVIRPDGKAATLVSKIRHAEGAPQVPWKWKIFFR